MVESRWGLAARRAQVALGRHLGSTLGARSWQHGGHGHLGRVFPDRLEGLTSARAHAISCSRLHAVSVIVAIDVGVCVTESFFSVAHAGLAHEDVLAWFFETGASAVCIAWSLWDSVGFALALVVLVESTVFSSR